MTRTLEGKLAIVTGASRGIGQAIATKLASYGANVVLGYTSTNSKTSVESFAEALRSQNGVKILPVQADLGTIEGPKAFIEEVLRNSALLKPDGPFQIDILVNNAGVAQNNLLPAIKPEQFDVSYRVNVRGPLLLTQAVEPYLPRDRSGRIINISSVSSSAGFIEQSVYGGTKAALEAMTRTWSRELSERCTVNAINPGPVLTEMYASNTPEFKREIKGWIEHSPLMRVRPGIDSQELIDDAPVSGGRPAYVDEIAGIVAMLTGVDASWCTGQVVCANGGMLMLH
ncbi:putative 3-oxoacyl-[acyl-carrier-protein] reductase [Rosellinia necatrix]|uniref:Putative 3-oxoacyl-[acyl-carrier-protein] reductase n=1 Tax=Rosellinia necatrix TaxID=77044 RepID=A0A1W2TD20_ROSNE|nr:putative 3-oxoacyl-[acyl-carrier-protein] reductase [Rosellinia necatrix]